MAIKYQIIYFPYLCYSYSPLKFEGMLLWDFYKEKDKLIPDQSLREYIEKLISANTFNDRPLKGMAVFSEVIPSFSFQKKKMMLAEELRRILFLCTVSKRNTFHGENAGHFMATSENFTHIFQNFEMGGEFTSITSGGIVQIMDGGYEVGKVKYEKPPYVLQGNYRIDEDLLGSLKKLKRMDVKIYRRILRSAEAFMSGYFNSHDLSDESRLLQQSRAFEILLQFPVDGQRKYFKEKIRFYCLPRDKRFQQEIRFKSERTKSLRVWEKNIMAGQWADKFYLLRNRIIHGDKISSKDFLFKKQRYMDLALWFYVLLIKKIINESLGKDVFYDQILWKKLGFEYEMGDVYKWVVRASKKYKGKILVRKNSISV